MGKRTILVVDDQKINRKILGKILSEDYDILEAENGESALTCLRNNSNISAVLLDIVMPVMDGYEVLKTMRDDSVLSKIPVIVSSQKDGDEAEVLALSLGAQDYIAKPYKGNIIKHRLKNTIRLRETAAIVNRVEKDELTGIYNKQFFIDKVEEQLRSNPDTKFDLVCLGIERFKLVNDTYGTKKGDELLCYIADVLKGISKEKGICGRFESDSFYMFLPNNGTYTDDDFLPLVQKINDFSIDMDIKIHCGVYEIQDHNASVAVMCDWAGLACEKNRGKYDSNFSYYDDSIREKLFEEQFITSTMRTALEKGQFQVYYQPKYDLHTEMVAGAEALVRWIHPERGFLSPGAFIPLFEKNGFITQLDQYVWEQACKNIRSWMDEGYPPVPVSVNVSRADIFNPNLTDILVNLVNQYEIPISYLHLEITESAYTDNPEQIVTVVDQLHKLGFVIEMDDFGSGYSSLNMLAELPVDILKLDMKFVQNESTNTSSRGILSFVISLAKWMKLSVIAEGVETAEQISSLRSMDCNYVQGFYYAKPMPEHDFRIILSTGSVKGFTSTEELEEEEPKVDVSKEDRVILVVDDIEVNRGVLNSIFCDEYRVVEQENGQEALEYLEQHYEEVEVMMLDLLMPVMDGFQVLDAMGKNEKYKNIPVIVTSQGDLKAEERALDMGADDFISKPYSPQIVHHRVDNIIEIYRINYEKEHEISERRRKEEALMNSIPGGVAIYHVKKDGRVTTEYVSEGLARICGYSASDYLEYIKDDARINIIQEEKNDLKNKLEQKIAGNELMHELQHLYTKEGKIIPVQLDANVIAGEQLEADDLAILYAVHTKVSKEREDVMREQNRYRYILDNLDVAYIELNEDGQVYRSDKFDLYEMSKNSTIDIINNEGSYDGVYPDDLPILFEFFNRKKKGLPKVSVTLRLKMKDGTYRFTQMMGFFEYDESGKPIKSIGVLRDVDKEWMKQNRKLQEALLAAQKANEAKTDFLERVSHDMRTPLNGILGLSELMEDEVIDEKVSEELDQLKQSAQYLLHLIEDTLDVNLIEHGKMELHPRVCDGKTVLNNVITMAKPSMDAKGIKFKLEVGELPFTKLYLDVGRVEQVVMIVLSNAIKFSKTGGTIEMNMENISNEDGVITDCITITDYGIGISEEFLPHVFEPFSQEHNDTKSIYQGTGLGMTIAKQSIELMGGRMQVESKEGIETKVSILLPMPIATKEQLQDWDDLQEEMILQRLNGKRILLCEDHPLNAEIAIKLLKKKGVHVDHAENGKRGLELYIKSSKYYYDAILMDVRMPVMDGLEATRRIRGLSRNDAQQIPIIAMTANTLSEDVNKSMNAGMSEHIGKPVEPSKLYRILSEYISKPEPFLGKKVLVVDDVEVNRLAVQAAIEELYQVIEAENGEEALALLESNQDIVAVVTDIQMPRMDGKELIQRIRQNEAYSNIVILANTIYGEHGQEEELLNLGANDFVYKPTSPRIIQMRLSRTLRNL